MTRVSCIGCCRKHLMQAREILFEVEKGYPTFWEFAVGHLAEAEDEIVAEYPEFARVIREERLTVEKLKGRYTPDFENLILHIRDMLAEVEKSADKLKAELDGWSKEAT